jgi:hypothetical protein
MSYVTMSQDEADDLLNITADSLAKRAGVDASGPLTDDGFTDEQRVTRLKMQVRTHTKDVRIPLFLTHDQAGLWPALAAVSPDAALWVRRFDLLSKHYFEH